MQMYMLKGIINSFFNLTYRMVDNEQQTVKTA